MANNLKELRLVNINPQQQLSQIPFSNHSEFGGFSTTTTSSSSSRPSGAGLLQLSPLRMGGPSSGGPGSSAQETAADLALQLKFSRGTESRNTFHGGGGTSSRDRRRLLAATLAAQQAATAGPGGGGVLSPLLENNISAGGPDDFGGGGGGMRSGGDYQYGPQGLHHQHRSPNNFLSKLSSKFVKRYFYYFF